MTPCPSCGRTDCHIWRRYAAINKAMKESFSGKEVIEEKKPMLRDYFNPLFYIRKLIGEIMDPQLERIEAAAKKISDAATSLVDNIAAEAAQFQTNIQAIRDAATNPDLTGIASVQLAKIADELEASVAKLTSAGEAVKNIVPDGPVTDTADGPAPEKTAPVTEEEPATDLREEAKDILGSEI